jgi:hypothetical protein
MRTETETRTVTTARRIAFVQSDGRPVTGATYLPAGTTVHARLRRDGRTWSVRVAGTLLCQDVFASALNLA